jgi:hypothetical protein
MLAFIAVTLLVTFFTGSLLCGFLVATIAYLLFK